MSFYKASTDKGRIGGVGNFGKKIIFTVTDSKILTFSDLQENISARWSERNIQKKKPRSEFLGANLRTVTLTIVLDASLGVKPMAMRNKLIKICEKGQVEYLVVGSKRLSSHKFKIESISNAWDYIIKKGKVVQMTMDVTFSEYIK
jgi:hypothetical protein